MNLAIATTFCAFVLVMLWYVRRNPAVYLRRIAGLEAVDEAIGRATEMGKPALFCHGLGGVSELPTLASLSILSRIGRRIAARLEPFTLTLDRLGCFPSTARARVLWLGGDASPVFHGLAASLHHELSTLGFPPERKPTVAHVTLARIKGRPDPKLSRVLEESQPSDALKVRADRLVLMESVLTPSGGMYTPLFASRFVARPQKDAGNGD